MFDDLYPKSITSDDLRSRIEFLEKTYPNGIIAHKLIEHYKKQLSKSSR